MKNAVSACLEVRYQLRIRTMRYEEAYMQCAIKVYDDDGDDGEIVNFRPSKIQHKILED